MRKKQIKIPIYNIAELIRIKTEAALSGALDELDAYEELINAGVNVEMMRKCLGDEAADHMEKFCYEHGLL